MALCRNTWDERKKMYKDICGGEGWTRKTPPPEYGHGFTARTSVDGAVASTIMPSVSRSNVIVSACFFGQLAIFLIRKYEFDRTKRVKLESAPRTKSYAKQSLILLFMTTATRVQCAETLVVLHAFTGRSLVVDYRAKAARVKIGRLGRVDNNIIVLCLSFPPTVRSMTTDGGPWAKKQKQS